MAGKRILIAEDDPVSLKLVRDVLQANGYDTTEVTNGEEVVANAVRSKPDLIVMDIRLPKMDGLQAASLIRKNPKTQAIPILAATAKALLGDREKCLASGCDDYIAKPFTYKALGAAIKKLLKSSES